MPNRSPGPRRLKSSSASSKPSLVSCSAWRRRCASSLGLVGEHAQKARVRTAPDPAPQLMQLSQPESLPALDGHHGCVGHVDPDFDHGGRHKYLGVAGFEAAHGEILFLGAHPPVHEIEPKGL